MTRRPESVDMMVKVHLPQQEQHRLIADPAALCPAREHKASRGEIGWAYCVEYRHRLIA